MAEIRIAVSLGGWTSDDSEATPDLIEIAVPVPDRLNFTAYEHRALVDTVATNTVSLVGAVRKPVDPVIDADALDETPVFTQINNFAGEKAA